MASVLQFEKSLTAPPADLPAPLGLRLRNYAGSDDIAPWLALRAEAFIRVNTPIRSWAPADFQAELLAKPWWSPTRLWLAEEEDGHEPPRLVGSVIVAMRGGGESAVPALHWLMVTPDRRRRGIARLLLAAAEQACWEAGRHRIVLETHAGWTAAVEFYRRHGYVECRGRQK